MPSKILFPDQIFDKLSLDFSDQMREFDQFIKTIGDEDESIQREKLWAYLAKVDQNISIEPRFLLELAISAGRVNKLILMQTLLQDILKHPAPHPRVFLLSAYAFDAEKIHKKRIKEQLALCLRRVRKNPDFKTEGHIATRILLSLHFD